MTKDTNKIRVDVQKTGAGFFTAMHKTGRGMAHRRKRALETQTNYTRSSKLGATKESLNGKAKS